MHSADVSFFVHSFSARVERSKSPASRRHNNQSETTSAIDDLEVPCYDPSQFIFWNQDRFWTFLSSLWSRLWFGILLEACTVCISSSILRWAPVFSLQAIKLSTTSLIGNAVQSSRTSVHNMYRSTYTYFLFFGGTRIFDVSQNGCILCIYLFVVTHLVSPVST